MVKNKITRRLFRTILLVLFPLSLYGSGHGIIVEIPVETSSISSQSGHAYSVPIRRGSSLLFLFSSDTSLAPLNSNAVLTEDGARLGPAHTPAEMVATLGNGRFLHQRKSFQFSTSDNSDPRSNGRHYRISGLATLPGLIPLALIIALIVSFRNSLRQIEQRLHQTADKLESFRLRSPVHRSVALIATIVVSALSVLTILRVPLPELILKGAFYSVYELFFVAGVILVLSFRLRGWLGQTLALTSILVLFCLPLIALWQQIGYHPSAIGGLIPWEDAAAYYYDARQLLEGVPFDVSARRPLYTAGLATLLKLTGQNLQMAILISVLVNAIACYLLAREIAITHGPLPAAIVAVLTFIFYRVEGGSGTLLTENLGLSLGLASLAVLWAALRRHQPINFAIGLGLLTLALCARNGTFFVLPALLIAGAIIFRGNRRLSVKFLLIGTATTTLGFLINFLLGRQISNPGTGVFSNFSQILYGIVVGGKGWQQVGRDFPTARVGSEIYQLALNHFLQHPLDLMIGLAKSFISYLPPGNVHLFSFIQHEYQIFAYPIYIACYLALIVGLYRSITNLRQPVASFLLAGIVGYFSSIPFAPPSDGGVRVYAATTGLIFILVAIQFSTRSHRSLMSENERHNPKLPHPALLFSLALLFCSVTVPILLLSQGHKSAPTVWSCPPPAEPFSFLYHPSAALRIIPDQHALYSTRVPEIQATTLQLWVARTTLRNDIDLLKPEHSFFYTFDTLSGAQLRPVIPFTLLPSGYPGSIFLNACGLRSANFSVNPVLHVYSIFRN